MIRPIKPRCIAKRPTTIYFKPQGIPLKELEEEVLFPDEFEAINLYIIDDLDQASAAEKMKISQPTFARILQRAHKKIATALVYGKAIRIEDNETY
jgi:predicted DNA-binding protein (UPF0251 family)